MYIIKEEECLFQASANNHAPSVCVCLEADVAADLSLLYWGKEKEEGWGQVEGETWVKERRAWRGEAIPHASQGQQKRPGLARLRDGATFSGHTPSNIIMVTVNFRAERPTVPERLVVGLEPWRGRRGLFLCCNHFSLI